MEYKAASQRRKRELADALKNLMQTKPFSKITVSELIKVCNINRNTFYYHFEDTNALLKWTLEQEAVQVVKKFDLITENKDAIYFVMDYVDENHKMILNICDSVGIGELRKFFSTDFYEIVSSVVNSFKKMKNITVDESYKDFLCRFFTEAMAGFLLEWISQDKHKDREETVEYISSTLHDSILSSLQTYNTNKSEA